MSSKEIAATLMADHMKCSRSQAASWGITHKIAAALDEAEARGAANAESNSLVALLTAPAEVAKKDKKPAKQTVQSTFGPGAMPEPQEPGVI